ncbi:MAG: 3-hydroxyacyl-ACP dehydratase FabZ family protein [Planctomycetota bacterium]|jgi:3-hydroxyacyl-[acyl-carrier-protein] dehydratase
MPPLPLVDFKEIDIEQVLFDREAIKEYVPHRHEMLQIDRIVAYDPEKGITVGLKDVGRDEFWVRGHIPGRPILPGMLLLEASAQLCTFHFRKDEDDDPNKFFGFAKVSEMKFRGVATPGDMIVFVVKLIKKKAITATYAAQAFVGGRLIFEAEIMGTTV